ncbi:hypothetical protein ABZ814_29020 [Micromonospora musae]|uniref:dCTP deaminase n=1 Tax=Micromonospora musae TaxID=1894970 RepID=UPI0033D90D0D
MILTGKEIVRQMELGHIRLDPFTPDAVNPNSYNYRLGPTIKEFDGLDGAGLPTFREVTIPEDGYVLQPGRMYLGHTFELIGSDRYAMSLIGRSSIGRLGLFLQVSADLGHTTSCHQWTLELVCVRPIRLYAGMRIGQVSFWCNQGDFTPYEGLYGRRNQPTESRLLASSAGRGATNQ